VPPQQVNNNIPKIVKGIEKTSLAKNVNQLTNKQYNKKKEAL